MAISTKDLVYTRDEMDNYRRRVEKEYYYRQMPTEYEQMMGMTRNYDKEMARSMQASQQLAYQEKPQASKKVEQTPAAPSNKNLLLCEDI